MRQTKQRGTMADLENDSLKKFHRRCPSCNYESHVKVMICKNCGFVFPTKPVDTETLIMKGEKSREGSNTHKILERMRRDIVKLYGAGIHACLLFTTVDNPLRQSSGFKAHSPLVKEVLANKEFSFLDLFTKAVKGVYLKEKVSTCTLSSTTDTAGQSSLEDPSPQKFSVSDTLSTGEPTAPHQKPVQTHPTPSQASVPLSTVPPQKPVQTHLTPSQASVPRSTAPPQKPVQTHPTPSQASAPRSTAPPQKSVQTHPTPSQASVPRSTAPPQKPVQTHPTPSQASVPLSMAPPQKPVQTHPTPLQASVPRSTAPPQKPIQTHPTPSQTSVLLSTAPPQKPVQTHRTPSQASVPRSTAPPQKPVQTHPTHSQASIQKSTTSSSAQSLPTSSDARSTTGLPSRPKRSCPSIFRKGFETEKEPKAERKMKSREIKKTKLSPKQVYYVDKIIKEKSENGKSFYLVKWKGYEEEENTWEPEENFDPALIKEYKDNKMN